MARTAGCSVIALGHTATDRAETLLLNLVRGAGAAGLSSMGWSRDSSGQLPLVRPLLQLDRSSTLAVCNLTGTQFWEDSTNSDQRFTRNRVRLSVLPLLTAINARAVQHIAVASEVLQAEDELLESMALHELRAASRHYSLLPVPAAAQQQQQQDQQQQQQQEQQQEQRRRRQRQRQRPTSLKAQASVWCKGLQAVSHKSGTALSIFYLQGLPRALKARVARAWLQQQLPTAPTYLAIQEVLGLLQPGQGSGQRTGSLWGSSCVMRHGQLLVLLDGADASSLHAGRLRLELQQQQQQQQQQLERKPPVQQDHAGVSPGACASATNGN
ncbi:hypothetical protein OEZ85_009345 [Tetradesmus obliquus]|uniref:tRNA(Ile)-lysidine synthetase n=1 Tax=Tetradesmus obliquus TaxID=3088 RepID=A0ABY8U9R2_TETOB|nr:hypothetical protein OEZ85_009345 [Tetradesmus obliquus]